MSKQRIPVCLSPNLQIKIKKKKHIKHIKKGYRTWQEKVNEIHHTEIKFKTYLEIYYLNKPKTIEINNHYVGWS